MEYEPFIRATEVWVPSDDGETIDLHSGIYGDMDYFATESRGMRFRRGEGLPGRVWQAGRPIILKDLYNSYFVRSEAARTEGLSCAVAMPIFNETGLTSVVVLFCGDDRFRLGALELWGLREGEDELSLVDGYFGHATCFERETMQTRFAKGCGIPGRVWASHRPEILPALGDGNRFVRHEAADRIGFDRAIGLPCESLDASPWVLALVSAHASPVAGRFEFWLLDPAQQAFRFVVGYCEVMGELKSHYRDLEVPYEIGPFGRACRKGIPLVDEDIATDMCSKTAQAAVEVGLSSMVVLPLRGGKAFDSVVVWYF